MPHPTRQTITKWAATLLLVLLITYIAGYFCIGQRRDIEESGERWSDIEFPSDAIATTYLPLGMLESAARRRAVVISAESEIQWTSWTCRPWDLPDKLELPPRSQLRY